jgi:hypothetical protein
MRSIPCEDEAHMESLVGDVLRMLSARADEDFATFKPEVEEKLKELYFILIETIGDLLEHMTNKDKLVIVPFEVIVQMLLLCRTTFWPMNRTRWMLECKDR